MDDPRAEDDPSGGVRIRPREARRGGLLVSAPADRARDLRAVCESFADEGYEVFMLGAAKDGARTAGDLLQAAGRAEGPLVLLEFGPSLEAALEAAPRGGAFSAVAVFGPPSPGRIAADPASAPLLVNMARDDARLAELLEAADARPDGSLKVFSYAAPPDFAVRPEFEDARTLAFLRVRQHFHRVLSGRERGA